MEISRDIDRTSKSDYFIIKIDFGFWKGWTSPHIDLLPIKYNRKPKHLNKVQKKTNQIFLVICDSSEKALSFEQELVNLYLEFCNSKIFKIREKYSDLMNDEITEMSEYFDDPVIKKLHRKKKMKNIIKKAK